MSTRLFAAYEAALVAAWPAAGELDLVRLYHASAVKYVWLGPMLLARAGTAQQTAYGGAGLDEASAAEQYRARGAALLTLCEWAERATS